jgi:hypothetical protein
MSLSIARNTFERLQQQQQRIVAAFLDEVDPPDEIGPLTQPPGGGGTGGAAVAVKVKLEGGSAGSNAAQCTFVYGIWPATGDIAQTAQRLAAALTPEERRTGIALVGRRVAATDGSFGVAFYDSAAGVWRLLSVPNERPGRRVCT